VIPGTDVDARPAGRTSRAPVGRAAAALAGVVAAAVALATAELVAGLVEDAPSLVLGVADVFVAETPGGIVRWSIRTLGASQKTVLVGGVVVASLGFGALLGLLGRRRAPWAAGGFVAFGVLGGWAGAGVAGASAAWAWASAAVAVAAGIGTLRLLLRLAAPTVGPRPAAPGPGDHPDGDHRDGRGPGPTLVTPGQVDRRRFLVTAGALAAVAAVGGGVGRRLRLARNVEGARRELAARLDAPPPEVPPGVTVFDEAVPGISSLVTPNADFYRIDTALVTPQVDPAGWSLRLTGMVDREVELSLDDLVAMGQVEGFVTMACVSNEVGGDLVGNALWSGVPLADLLDMAGARPDASQVVGRSVDGWTSGFPSELARDGRLAMVALAMNGEPLPVDHGFPARLIVPGLYGYVSATKWLTEIELTTFDGFDAYWVPRGWAKEGPIKTQSRIDVPRPGATVRAGRARAAGVAWAPTRGIERVEVRVDDGPWRPARLSGALSGDAWAQWLVDWDATPGDRRLQVRAVDGTGEVQTAEDAPPAPSGATGHHTVRVTVE
jgi:DMSO/TMAO reductase YedYZ molybdopterin-dependent catalytic subunit